MLGEDGHGRGERQEGVRGEQRDEEEDDEEEEEEEALFCLLRVHCLFLQWKRKTFLSSFVQRHH